MNRDRLVLMTAVLIMIGLAGFLMTNGLFIPHAIAGPLSSQRISMQTAQGGMMGEDHMRGMMDERMGARLPELLPEQLPDPKSSGAELLVRYCAQCHNLPSPATHSAEEWPEVVDRMSRHMSGMEGMRRRGMMRTHQPTEDEKKEIVQYLQAHGLKPFSAPSVPLPDSSGGRLFNDVCRRCHALPDIKLHSPKEWPAVVERMRMNMKVMGKPGISDRDRDDIAAYLKQNAN